MFHLYYLLESQINLTVIKLNQRKNNNNYSKFKSTQFLKLKLLTFIRSNPLRINWFSKRLLFSVQITFTLLKSEVVQSGPHKREGWTARVLRLTAEGPEIIPPPPQSDNNQAADSTQHIPISPYNQHTVPTLTQVSLRVSWQSVRTCRTQVNIVTVYFISTVKQFILMYPSSL